MLLCGLYIFEENFCGTKIENENSKKEKTKKNTALKKQYRLPIRARMHTHITHPQLSHSTNKYSNDGYYCYYWVMNDIECWRKFISNVTRWFHFIQWNAMIDAYACARVTHIKKTHIYLFLYENLPFTRITSNYKIKTERMNEWLIRFQAFSFIKSQRYILYILVECVMWRICNKAFEVWLDEHGWGRTFLHRFCDLSSAFWFNWMLRRIQDQFVMCHREAHFLLEISVVRLKRKPWALAHILYSIIFFRFFLFINHICEYRNEAISYWTLFLQRRFLTQVTRNFSFVGFDSFAKWWNNA